MSPKLLRVYWTVFILFWIMTAPKPPRDKMKVQNLMEFKGFGKFIFKIMENKQHQSLSKTVEITAFRLTQTLRTCNVPYPLVMVILTFKSTFYILPVILNVYSQRTIDSIFTNVILGLQVVRSALQFYLADVLIASLIIGGYVLIVAMFFTVFISIARRSEKGETQWKGMTTIFCIMSYLLYSLTFPLSYVLSMLILKQMTIMPLISIISALVLILFYVLGYWIQGIVSADLSGTISLMTKITNWHDGLILMLKMLIVNLTVLDISANPFFLTFTLLAAISLCLLELYHIIFSVKFYHRKVQNTYSTRVLEECVVISISFLVFIFPDPMIVGNLTIFHATIFILALCSLHSYFEHRNAALILLSPCEIRREGQALVYILQMMSLATKQHNNPLIKPFLISSHLRECRSPGCFCRSSLKQEIYKLANEKGFMDKLVLSCLQEVKTRFAKSLVVFSLCLNHRIVQNPSFSRVKHFLKQLTADHLSIYQRYFLFQLEEMVDHQIKEANSNRDNLPIQNIIRDSTSLNDLQDHLAKVTQILASKYRLMSVELVRLSQVAAISDKVNVYVRSIQAMWEKHSTTANNYNIEIDFLFLYYFQAIIPSYRQAHNLKRTLLQKTKKMSNVKGLYRKNGLIAMYSKRTCVLESVFEDQVGLVSNASKSVAQVLNVERDHIIGNDIHKFMPSFFAKGHKQVLSNWLTNESFNILKKGLVDCFTADRNHIAFSALTYLKVHSDGRQLKIYKMVIRDNDRDFLILRKSGAIEAIGSRLTELGVISESQLNKNFMELTEQNFLKRVKDNEKEWILVRPFKNHRKSQSSEIVSNRSFQDEEREEEEEETAFQCWVVKKQQLMGDYSYIVIQFLEIRTGVFVPTNVEEEFRQSSSRILKSMRSIRDADGYTSDHIISRNDIQEDGQFIRESSSCQTSSEGKKGGYSKLVLVLKEMTCNPAKIRLKWRLLVTVIFVFILVSGVTEVYLEKIVFEIGFSSFSDIVMANRNISSTHQLLQMLYNNALMAQTYCPQEDRCQKILQSSSFMLSQFYSSYSGDLQEYFKEVAKMSGIKLSSSYNQVLLINLNEKVVEVSSHEFMEYYYQWLKTVERKESSSGEVREAMNLLSLNWETLKSLSKQTISFYSLAGQQQLKSILTFFIALLSIICLFVSGLLIAFKTYINYRAQQKTLLLNMYKKISRKTANTLQEYFTATKGRVGQLTYPTVQGEHSHQGVLSYQQKSSFNLFVPILLMLASPSFLFLVTAPLSMLSPANSTLDTSTALIETQDHLLESYFQLKTYYMGYNFSKSQSQIEEQILIHLNQTEIELGSVVRNTFPLFEAMDASFGKDFNHLLTENICELTSSLLPLEVSEQCKKVQDVNILTRGVMTGMNFLQRTTMKALIALRSSNDADKAAYFTTTIFQDMDDYLIYLFRVSQLLSFRVIEAFREKIPAGERLISLNFVFFIVAGTMVAIFWFVSARGERNQLSDLCGYALQMPEPVLVRKNVLKQVNEILGLTSE